MRQVGIATVNDPTHLIVNRYLENDTSAFAQLMRRYQDRVFRLCYHLLRNRQDAEDATQETFTRVARHLDHWDQSRPLEPWLMTIAGNRCRTVLARRRPHISLAEGYDPSSNSSSQQREAEFLEEEIRLALDEIREEHREAFILFHQHQLSYQEIADRLDCPVGTIKTWVHRARAQLIRHLRQRDVLGVSRNAM